MKTRIMICIGLVVSLFALSLLPAAASQEDDCYSKDGNWSADTQKCTVTVGVQVNIDYPLDMVQYPAVTKVIDAFITDQQKSFIASYAPDYTLPAHVNNWGMTVTNQTFKYSDEIQTVLFDISFYTGGAHPNSGYRSFTFDVNKGTEYQLSDIFTGGKVPLDAISKLAQDDLKKKLGDMYDSTMLEAGTTPSTPDNYKNWALTPTSIIFFFDPYQVAPYAAGPQQVEIPFTELKGMLAKPFGS